MLTSRDEVFEGSNDTDILDLYSNCVDHENSSKASSAPYLYDLKIVWFETD